MKTFTPLVIGLLAFATVSQARIGESLEQCEERYGRVVASAEEERLEKPSKTYTFSKGGIEIRATITEGKVVALQFTSASQDALLEPMPLTTDQIGSFLTRNAGAWYPPKQFPPFTAWDSDDGSLFAQYDERSKTLTICQKEVSEAFTQKDGTAPADF